ncbi:hypothetical protein VNO80_15134 [Phaseolus coccineus]|uniref:Sec-independent protein translocase protein TatB n=1 Tax=Phaseolus coccineus TaxID=3886 RepID=A0AAN9MJP0_PHACN
MLGFSYGEIFLLLGVTAAVIGPKDLPIISRTAGRLAGRAIGYVQLARGQFENVMQQSQARQVHKELQDTMAQLDAIRHEIRTISIINPGPLTRSFVDNPNQTSVPRDNIKPEDSGENHLKPTVIKDSTPVSSSSCNMQNQATIYARLAESPAIKNELSASSPEVEKIDDKLQLTSVLPISAESAGLLPNRGDDVKGSDIVLEAILEAEVAHNAKEFFSQPQNQVKYGNPT